MGIGLAIVISVAIMSVCGMITILGVAGIKYGDKYQKHDDKKNEK